MQTKAPFAAANGAFLYKIFNFFKLEFVGLNNAKSQNPISNQ
jgi:hypothetical protein